MNGLEAVAPLVAVAAPVAVVLREVVAYDRGSGHAWRRPDAGADVPVVADAGDAVDGLDEVDAVDAVDAGVPAAALAERVPERDPAPAAARGGVALAEHPVPEAAPAAGGAGDGARGGDGGRGGGAAAAVADGGGYEVVEVTLGIEATVVAQRAPHSMLSGLATEDDDRSPERRAVAGVLLLVVTLVVAALVGAGVYNAVSALR